MNLNLLKNPSTQNWQNELDNILSGNRNLTIGKLGNIGTYIRNHFIDTPEDKREFSISTFFFAFDEFINKLINSNFDFAPNCILMVSQVINSFRNSKYYNNSSKIGYLNKVAILLLNSIEKNKYEIEKYELSIYEFCRYLFFLLSNNLFSIPKNAIVNDKSIELLEKTYGLFNEELTNLTHYLLVKLNYKDISLLSLSLRSRIELTRLYISEKDYENTYLNQILMDVAIKDRDSFLSILKDRDCDFDHEFPTYIIYESDMTVREFSPSSVQLEALISTYSTTESSINIFENKVASICL